MRRVFKRFLKIERDNPALITINKNGLHCDCLVCSDGNARPSSLEERDGLRRSSGRLGADLEVTEITVFILVKMTGCSKLHCQVQGEHQKQTDNLDILSKSSSGWTKHGRGLSDPLSRRRHPRWTGWQPLVLILISIRVITNI